MHLGGEAQLGGRPRAPANCALSPGSALPQHSMLLELEAGSNGAGRKLCRQLLFMMEMEE